MSCVVIELVAEFLLMKAASDSELLFPYVLAVQVHVVLRRFEIYSVVVKVY